MNAHEIIAGLSEAAVEALRQHAQYMYHLNCTWLPFTIFAATASLAVVVWGAIRHRRSGGVEGQAMLVIGALCVLLFGIVSFVLFADNYMIGKAPEAWAFKQMVF